MNYLIDTNVISEFTKPTPNENVQTWLQAHEQDGLYLSVITIGEIQQGIFRLPHSEKRNRLLKWLNESILTKYVNFIIPLNVDVMLQWGAITGSLKQQGETLPIMDSLIASTAKKYQLILVSRNKSDFIETEIEVINPWE